MCIPSTRRLNPALLLCLTTMLWIGCTARSPDERLANKTAESSPEQHAQGKTAGQSTGTATDVSKSVGASPAEVKSPAFPPSRTMAAPRPAPQPVPLPDPSLAPQTAPPIEPSVAETIDPADATVMTVYYGTDRLARDQPVRPPIMGPRAWFYCAAGAAGATILLAAAALRFATSRALRHGTILGLTLTIGLGAMTLVAKSYDGPSGGSFPGYSGDRGPMDLGVCQVSIPKRHEAGKVERPTVWRLELQEDPLKHVMLLEIVPQPADEYFGSLRQTVGRSPRKEAFVFIHGYNVSFEDAARRTAQLAYDLNFEGAPIFFSWPSQASVLQYAVDETNVAWAVPHIKEFLVSVARQSGAESVHLIAHSMGNRGLTSALVILAHQMKSEMPMFHEVVLTAPDIDADVFQRDIAPVIAGAGRRVTLYASSSDEALVLSRKVHGYPRAGDSGQNLCVYPGIDTIDVSGVDTSLVGHSYYGSNRTVLTDIFHVLRESLPAENRAWLAPMVLRDLRYWVFAQGDAVRAARADRDTQ